jgi:hypothetical protein
MKFTVLCKKSYLKGSLLLVIKYFRVQLKITLYFIWAPFRVGAEPKEIIFFVKWDTSIFSIKVFSENI